MNWRPIRIAPMDGTAILARWRDAPTPVVVRYKAGEWRVAWDDYPLTGTNTPYEWLPLP